MAEKKELTLKNYLLYGIGDLYGGGAFFLIGLLFLNYLTDVIKISAGLAGTIMLVGKIWDAVSDPLMGYISDRTRSPFGRRRVYFLIGIIPIALSFFLLWNPVRAGNQHLNYIYYLINYMFVCTVLTMVMVPYSTLNAEMTRNYRQRTRMTGFRLFFGQFSVLIAAVLPTWIINSFADKGQGYRMMGLVFGLLYALPWIFVFLGTWEMNDSKKKKRTKPLKDIYLNFLSTLKNRSFRLHLGVYIFSYVAIDILMAMFIYYINYYLKLDNIYSLFLGTIVISQLLFLPVYTYLSNKIGRGKSFVIGATVWIIGLSIILLAGTGFSLIGIIIACITIGAGMSAGVLIPWAMLPSITDVDELITGKRREGVYAGFMTFTRKVAQSIALFILGLILEFIGYVPGVEQSPQSLLGIKLVTGLLPIILIVLALVFALKFQITPDTHRLMTAEIMRLKKGGSKKKVKKEVKKVCEELTGLDYKELYY